MDSKWSEWPGSSGTLGEHEGRAIDQAQYDDLTAIIAAQAAEIARLKAELVRWQLGDESEAHDGE